MTDGSVHDADNPRSTCNIAYEVTTQPAVARQFRALFVKNLKIMMRDYAPTINSILSPVYFLVILIFLSLATTRPDKAFKTNALPYLTNGTCLPDETAECVHLAYTSSRDVGAIVEQLRAFFQTSEPHAAVVKAYASADDIVAQYDRNPRSVVVAVDFLDLDVGSLASGNNTRYEILANHTAIYTSYIDSRFLTAQAYVERAIVNVQRRAQQLPPLSSPLPPQGTPVAKDASDAAGLPFITYAPFIGKYKPGLSGVYPFYMLFCFQPIWQIVLTWLARENETGIKASLIAMGLRPSVYQLSVWATQALLSIPISALMVGIVYAGQIFRTTSWYLVFVLFILFSWTAVGIGLLLAIPFKGESAKASNVSMIFAVLFLVAYGLTFGFFYSTGSASDVAAETATFLVSPLAFARAIERISTKEMTGGGITAETFSASPLGRIYYMLAVDALLYLVLALYLDRIFPGKNCHPLPWDYLLRPSFWRTDAQGASPSQPSLRHDDPADAAISDKVEPFDVTALPEEDRGIITIRQLRKSFRVPGKGLFNTKVTVHHAVNGFSMQVHRNEIFGLLGHNGAGKTTTMSMLTGGLQPDSGEVWVGGLALPSAAMARSEVDLGALSAVQRQLGVCPQHDVLFEHLTALETLRLFADVKGVVVARRSSAEGGVPALDDYIRHLLADVHLAEKDHHLVWTFSGGMKRKLSVAVAFLGDPKVVLLDEPTTGMDVYTRKQIWQLIQDSKRGRAIVLTTHSMEEADALGDRIAIMSKGELQAQGTTLFLKNRFGVGYRLHVEKKRGTAWDGSALDELVKQQFP
ncbi:P-loop containing nucleoside triphosphate hydrolase protein, partial [Syncephalis pseudoplumigaleata]